MKIFKNLIAILLCITCVGMLVGLLDVFNTSEVPDTENSITSDSGSGNNTTEEVSSSEKKEVVLTELDYVSLGDSITYGSINGKKGTPYCDIVAETLNLASITNRGVGGQTLSNAGKWGSIISQLSKITPEADIISVMGGVNDWAQGVELGNIDDTDSKTIYGGLNYIAHYLKIHYSDSFIFFMTVLPVGDAKHLQYDDVAKCTIEEINVAIKEVAQKYNIPVLDTYELADYQSEMNNSALTDGCHPSQQFHEEVLAPLVAKFIEDNYKEYVKH